MDSRKKIITACVLWVVCLGLWFNYAYTQDVVGAVPEHFAAAINMVKDASSDSDGNKSIAKHTIVSGEAVTFFIKFFPKQNAVGVGVSRESLFLAAEFYLSTGRVCIVRVLFNDFSKLERAEVKTDEDKLVIKTFVEEILNIINKSEKIASIEG